MNTQKHIHWTSFWAFLLAFLFAYSSFSKLLSVNEFQMSLFTIYPFPPVVMTAFMFIVPVVELGISFLLIYRKFYGLLAGFFTLLIFTLVVQFALGRGHEVSCGCFGGYDPVDPVWFIARNAILLAVTYFAMLDVRKLDKNS